MVGRQLRILITLLLLSTAAFADALNVRSHPRDIFRRTSIAEHVKEQFDKKTGTIVKLPDAEGKNPTYHGSVPVPEGITEHSPKELDEYAKAANAHLGDKAKNYDEHHVIGAAYRPGSKRVHLHSQPKGTYTSLDDTHTHVALAGKMRETGQEHPDRPQKDGKRRLNHHAETAAINKGMKEEGSSKTSEWTVGQHGHFVGGKPVLQPCRACRTTLDAAGSTYHDIHGNVKNPQPLPASHQHASTSDQHASTSTQHAAAPPPPALKRKATGPLTHDEKPPKTKKL